jgi:type II secretory pathway pseudopilin PulG
MAVKGLWMSPGAKIAIVVLFFLSLAVSGVVYLAAVHYYQASQAAQQRQAAQQQASQQRQAAQQQAAQLQQAAAFERKLCATLGRLAALPPPPGSGSANPSRAYLQQQHQVLAELGPDVGCKGRP